MSEGKGPDLARSWRDRRARVAEAERAEREAAELEAARPEREAREAEAREANRRAAEAIDIETIDATSDVAAFLKDGVPAALRRRALRALWRADPVFANLDRLNDYDENFRDPSRTLETLQSAWQAGRGYLFPEDEEKEEGEGDGEQAGAEVADADVAPASAPEPELLAGTEDSSPHAIVDSGSIGPDAETAAPVMAEGSAAEGGAADERAALEVEPPDPGSAHGSLRARLGL